MASGATLDYETATSHDITVRVTDSAGLTYDEVVTIYVTNVNDAPTDLSSGIELNTDGGNDAFFQTSDGGVIFGGQAEVSVEVSFQLDVSAGVAPHLFSYATAAEDEEFKVYLSTSNEIAVSIGGNTFTGAVHSELRNGDLHQVSVTWDSSSGAVAFYVDGEYSSSGTVSAGYTLGSTGTLVVGQGQPSVGMVTAQEFAGTIFDLRIWDEVRSEAEIALNYQQKLDSGTLPSGLVANWQMDGFNGSNEVIDIVSGNNLSIGHAIGAGFTTSTPVGDLHVIENVANGTSVGFVVPTDPEVSNDIVKDGLFLEAGTPSLSITYSVGETFGDWFVDSGSIQLLGDWFADSPNGGGSIDMNGSSTGAISQTLVTEIGMEYQVTFAETGMWTFDTNIKDIRVSAAGTSQDFSVSYDASWDKDTSPLWQPQTFSFTATSTSTTLAFTSLEAGNAGAVIADVQVLEIPSAISTILANDPTLSYDAATDKFYRFVNTPDNFFAALTSSIGDELNGVSGQLVTIESNYENELIRQYAQASGNDIWLGTYDANNDGNWNWLNGTTESSDQFWIGGNTGSAAPGFFAPAFGQSESVGEEYARLLSDGSWADDTEGALRAYVVEWDASEVLSSFTFTLTDDAGGRFAIDSTTGEVTVADSSLIDYEVAMSHNITVQTTNAAGNTYSEVMTIKVDDDITEPVLITDPGGGTRYESDTFGTLVDGNVSITDADSVDFDGGELTVTLLNNAEIGDKLRIDDGDGVTVSGSDISYDDGGGAVIVGTFTGGTNHTTPLVITFNTNADAIAVEAVAQHVVFLATGDNTTSTAREITMQVTDGDGGTSSVGTRVINVVPVNDAPTFEVGDGSTVTSVATLYDSAVDMVIQDDGKYLVLTSANTAPTGQDIDYALTRYNADGSLDTSFGTDGTVITAVNANNESPQAMALQADGKILVTGGYDTGSTTDGIVMRYNNDGTLDTSFDTDGIVTIQFSATNNDLFTDILVQPDGRILVAGYGNITGNDEMIVARLNVDGTLDTSFSADGKFILSLSANDDRVMSLALQDDGRIILAGYENTGVNSDLAIVRLGANGGLDTSFVSAGFFRLDLGGNEYANAVAIDDSGRIVVAGTTSSTGSGDSIVVRVDANGVLDSTFGTGGIVTVATGSPFEAVNELAIQSDGKIVVAGDAFNGSNNDISIFRLNDDGSLDTGFDTDGLVRTDLSGATDSVNALAIDKDGTILVAGRADYTNGDTFIARYNSDGSLDERFDLANTLDGAPTFTEGGSAVVLDSDVQIFDAELSGADNFDGATLTLERNTAANVDDIFSATGTLSTLSEGSTLVVGTTTIGTVTTNSAGTLVLTFNANATNDLVNQAMQQIAYSNANDAPQSSVQIDWVFNDGNTGNQGTGGALDITGSTTVTITPVNDAPIAVNDRSSLTFDGVDDYIQIADDPNLVMTDTLTLEVWVNPDDVSAFENMILNKEGEYELAIKNGTIQWGVANTDPGWDWYDTGYAVSDNEWTHIAFSYDNGVANIYVNGTLVDTYNGSGTIGDAYPTMNELHIGGRTNNPSGLYFDGQIADVRIWNTVRTEAEISANQNALLTGSETGLMGYWLLDDGSTTAIDSSLTGNDGLLGGGVATQQPTWSDFTVDEDGILNVSAPGILINDFDADGDTLTVNTTPIVDVSHGVLSLNSDGSFMYTPDADFNGIDNFIYEISDGNGGTDTATVDILVREVNDAPTGTDTTVTATEDTTYTFSISDFGYSDIDGDTISYVYITNVPAEGTLFWDGNVVDNGDFIYAPDIANGLMTYEAPLNASGTNYTSFTFEVQDDGGTTNGGVDRDPTPNTITIDLTPVNDAPVLDPIGNQNVDELSTLTFTATASDSDLPSDTLTFSLDAASIAAGMTIDSATGVFTWTPTESDGGTTPSVTVTVTDSGTGNLVDSETFTITVNDTNTAPVLDPIGNQSVDELSTLTFTATASDSDIPTDTLTFSLDAASLAAGMSIDANTGEFSWTPTESDGGTIPSVTITVTDSGTGNLVDSETFTITVNDVNVAPVLDPIGNQSIDELTTLTFTATASDSDIPVDTLTYSLDAASIAAGMTIDSATGEFNWTPTEAQGGSTPSVTITVTDSGTGNLMDSETFTITVNDTNTAPVLDPIGNQSVDELATLTFTATATDSDVPTDTLTFSLDAASLAAGMTIDSATGVFTWTPSETDGGTTPSVTVTVTDSGTGSLVDSETFTITVNDVNVAPILDPIGNQSIDELATLTFTATASDSDLPSDTLTYSLDAASLAAGMTIDANTGEFNWTPTESDGGTIPSVTITVTDSGTGNLVDSETFTITVNDTNTAPVLDPIGNQSVDELSTLTFTATATDLQRQQVTVIFL